MLARVKWQGDRLHVWEYGTLLGFVYASGGPKCMIAMDGSTSDGNRGKIVQIGYALVTVTTWFRWDK